MERNERTHYTLQATRHSERSLPRRSLGRSFPGFELPLLLPVFLGGEMSEDSGAAESRQLNFNEYDDDYYADNGGGGGGGGGDYGDYGAQRRMQRTRQRKQLAQRRSLLARRQLAVQKDRTNLA